MPKWTQVERDDRLFASIYKTDLSVAKCTHGDATLCSKSHPHLAENHPFPKVSQKVLHPYLSVALAP